VFINAKVENENKTSKKRDPLTRLSLTNKQCNVPGNAKNTTVSINANAKTQCFWMHCIATTSEQ